jgi:hypothetical protein
VLGIVHCVSILAGASIGNAAVCGDVVPRNLYARNIALSATLLEKSAIGSDDRATRVRLVERGEAMRGEYVWIP